MTLEEKINRLEQQTDDLTNIVSKHLSEICSSNQRIVLYGAGRDGKFVANKLLSRNPSMSLLFWDKDPSKHGSDGIRIDESLIPCVEPGVLPLDTRIIICSLIHQESILKELQMQYKHQTIDSDLCSLLYYLKGMEEDLLFRKSEKEFIDLLNKEGLLSVKDFWTLRSEKNPNNTQLLFYSCLMVEQFEKNEESELFWQQEINKETEWKALLAYQEKQINRKWPTEVEIECSTYCNGKCSNCTHESLIRSGDKPLVHVPLEIIKYRIRKSALMMQLGTGARNADFYPIGLGEPFYTHPSWRR